MFSETPLMFVISSSFSPENVTKPAKLICFATVPKVGVPTIGSAPATVSITE